jgi:hypothetical protein
VVENAAQNSRTIYAATITTLNRQSGLATLPGPGIGGGLGGSPSAGAGNGAGASQAARLRLRLARSITRSFYRSSLALGGRLLDAQAQPIGGASMEVLEQLNGSNQMRVIAHARTGADGSFVARVPAGPSRAIEVGYRAFASEASYASEAKIQESVGAGVELSVSRHHVGSTGTVVFSGRVRGRIPPRGAIVELLVRYRGRWEPFRAPRTDSAGRYRVAYQFQGAVGRFPFRAEVPAGQMGFPFAAGFSNVVVVGTG